MAVPTDQQAKLAERGIPWFVGIACLALLVFWIVGALAPRGYRAVTDAGVPLDGSFLATKPLRSTADFEYQLVLTGTYTFSHDGQAYDALHPTSMTGGRTAPSGGLPFTKIEPRSLSLVEADEARHRYVYAPTENADLEGQSLRVGIDTDLFVRHFVLAPSQVRSALSGGLHVQLLERRRESSRTPAMAFLYRHFPLALVVILVLGLLGFRRRKSDSEDDVKPVLKRIDAKYRRASRQADKGGEFYVEMIRQLAELQQSAHLIAGKLAKDNPEDRAQRLAALDGEIASLEGRRDQATDDRVREECQAALDGKIEARAALQSVQAQRDRGIMRLSKIEAALDSSLAKMDDVQLEFAADGNENPALGAIRHELDMIRDTLDDIRAEFGDRPV